MPRSYARPHKGLDLIGKEDLTLSCEFPLSGKCMGLDSCPYKVQQLLWFLYECSDKPRMELILS